MKYKVGDQIGKMTLISYKNTKWTVLCACGKEWTTRTSRLVDRESCPECTPQKPFRHYEVGEELFGYTLLEKEPNKRWKMKCKCGAIRNGSPNDLTRYATCKNCYSAEETGRKKRLPNNISLYRERLAYYLRAARSRNLDWELTEDQFIQLITQPCTYCGEVNSMQGIAKDRSIQVNGIDRKDNNLGYTIINSVPCCNFCNHAKKNHTCSFFIDKIKSIANYLSSTTIES